MDTVRVSPAEQIGLGPESYDPATRTVTFKRGISVELCERDAFFYARIAEGEAVYAEGLDGKSVTLCGECVRGLTEAAKRL